MRKGLFVLAILISSGVFAEDITVKMDMWCPYNCVPNSSEPGILIELMEKALVPAGHKIIYQELNWARALMSVASGEISAIGGLNEEEAKENHLLYSPNVALNSTMCFYALPESKWSYSGPLSLKEIKLGIVKSYIYGDPAIDSYISNQANESRLNIAYGNLALENNIKKIEMKGIDALIEEKNVVSYYLKTHPNVKLKKISCLKESKAFIAFSRKNPKADEYLKLISLKIEELKKNGEYQKLLLKYGVETNEGA